MERLDVCLLSIILLHWLAISIWPMWWGGWSYGPRMFTDVLPYFFYFMIPVFTQASRWKRWQQVAWATGLAPLMIWSFAVHYRGANDVTTLEWNSKPVYVDEYPDRLWNWVDPQFARGLKWGAPIDLALSGVPILYFDSATYPLLGGNQLRLRKFDVSSALIAPPGPGWLAIADQQPVSPELAPLWANVMAKGHFQTITDHIPYTLYYFDLGQRLSQAAARAKQIVVNSSTHQTVTLPVQFGQVLQLVGHEANSSPTSDAINIITYWRVLRPTESPVKLAVRAIGQDGQSVAQEERLDVAAPSWQAGDLIAQVNRLTIPHKSAPVWIEASLVEPDSEEMLPIMLNNQVIGREILLDHIDFQP